MERDKFVRVYSQCIINNKASLFLGAGFSINSGLPSWKQLIAPLAKDLDIKMDSYHDFAQITQYYENARSRRDLLDEIIKQIRKPVKPNPILAELLSLNFENIWTTNYDNIIEKSLDENGIKYNTIANDSNVGFHSQNAVNVFKCGGDTNNITDIFLTKTDYEDYSNSRKAILSFLTNDLIVKDFLFIGYSFKDQLIKQAIRNVNNLVPVTNKHYAIFIENDDPDFDHFLKDLEKNYNLRTVVVKDENEFLDLIKDLISAVKKHYVFISGSYDFKEDKETKALFAFCKALTIELIKNDYCIVSFAGQNIGDYICGVALKQLEKCDGQEIHSRLILEPLPTEEKDAELVKTFRKNALKKCGSAIFISGGFGKNQNRESGTFQEFDLARELKLNLIPVRETGGTAYQIADAINGLKIDSVDHEVSIEENEIEKIVQNVINSLAEGSK